MQRNAFLRNLFVSATLFGLFVEWLRPLTAMAEMTEVHRLVPFLGAVAFYMILDALPIRGWASWPLKLVFTIGWIGYWFQRKAFAAGDWWSEALRLAAADMDRIGSGTWFVSPETRTFLFLAGWSALVYAVQRITVERGQTLWFVASTICFLVLLQLWPGLDTGAGVLRSAAIGLLLLTVQQGVRWERLLGSRFPEGTQAAWSRVVVGLLCGLAAYGAGYGLSAGTPAKVDPLPLEQWNDWVAEAAERRWDRLPADAALADRLMASSASARTGFGGDDSRLGRAVTPDASLAFEAVAPRPTYWRGGTKDVYTGQGWRDSALEDTGKVFQGVRRAEGADTETYSITVLDPDLSKQVFTGGTILRFLTLENAEGERLSDIHIRYDPDDDGYYVGTDAVALGAYRIETAAPTATPETLMRDDGAVPAEPSSRYLQLPDSLPERVRSLARDIVADVPDDRYSQAAAIAAYLRDRYTYTLDTTPAPAGRDFVDYFLFDTKVGYCDHFSTAMVTLLRAVGIEARWAKGFAPGTPDPDRPDTYVVRNADAHSWVEVRFADAGWVPFEPTPSAFADAAAQAVEAAASDAEAAGEAPTLAASAAEWLGGAETRLRELAAAARAELDAAAPQLPGAWRAPLAWGAFAAAAIAAVYAAALLARLFRRRPRPAGAEPYGAPFPAAPTPERRRLDRLWRRIYRQRGARLPHETLRDYAARLTVETPAARAALEELMRYDESVRYGGSDARAKRVSRRWYDDVWRGIAK
ncbi:transglutaminase domain-containing protein [Paenibacillus sp. TRM 82003]|nr:transglutaminase domain-containing protein [Paenibacillus sp. TRM 82003]